MDIRNEFSKINIEEWNTGKGKRYFDPIRKIFVPITPEELVRQRMIIFLQNVIGVPSYCLHSEEHLIHYGVKVNGRMDIVINEYRGDEEYPLAVVECKKEDIFINAEQVINQALCYSIHLGAKYFILVNGIKMQYFRLEKDSFFPIQDTLTYRQMIADNNGTPTPQTRFERLGYEEYYDVNALLKKPWIDSKIGADTRKGFIPFIINLDDCFMDVDKQLVKIDCQDFELTEDLGTQLRQYNDASGGGFGTGVYRSFIVKDNRSGRNFLIGFSIISTGKTINDLKYGNTNGKSVLVIIVNDGDTDEMSAQINMNQYLSVSNDLKVRLTHNGAVTRKGARKEDLFSYIEQFSDRLVSKGRIDFGELDCSVPLTMHNDDVVTFISRLIEYSVYRNEYKKSLSKKK